MGSGLKFPPRVKALRDLEGWYSVPQNEWKNGNYQFKLSCRFHDILRCSTFNGKTVHFNSCYNPRNGVYPGTPTLAALNPNVGIIYVPDRHGNFLGRAFVRWVSWNWRKPFSSGYLEVCSVYGNKLQYYQIRDALKRVGVTCRKSDHDIGYYV